MVEEEMRDMESPDIPTVRTETQILRRNGITLRIALAWPDAGGAIEEVALIPPGWLDVAWSDGAMMRSLAVKNKRNGKNMPVIKFEEPSFGAHLNRIGRDNGRENERAKLVCLTAMDAIQEKLGSNVQFHLAPKSRGAITAMQAAEEKPKRVASLTLNDPAGLCPPKDQKTAMLTFSSEGWSNFTARIQTEGYSYIRHEIAPKWGKFLLNPHREMHRAGATITENNIDLLFNLTYNLGIPTSFVFSNQDTFLPPQETRRFIESEMQERYPGQYQQLLANGLIQYRYEEGGHGLSGRSPVEQADIIYKAIAAISPAA